MNRALMMLALMGISSCACAMKRRSASVARTRFTLSVSREELMRGPLSYKMDFVFQKGLKHWRSLVWMWDFVQETATCIAPCTFYNDIERLVAEIEGVMSQLEYVRLGGADRERFSKLKCLAQKFKAFQKKVAAHSFRG